MAVIDSAGSPPAPTDQSQADLADILPAASRPADLPAVDIPGQLEIALSIGAVEAAVVRAANTKGAIGVVEAAVVVAAQALGAQIDTEFDRAGRCRIMMDMLGQRITVAVWVNGNEPAGWRSGRFCPLCGQNVGQSHPCSALDNCTVVLGDKKGVTSSSVVFLGPVEPYQLDPPAVVLRVRWYRRLWRFLTQAARRAERRRDQLCPLL